MLVAMAGEFIVAMGCEYIALKGRDISAQAEGLGSVV
jgi:hypothetical protein